MINFVDRQAESINRKVLNVVNVNYKDDGSIDSLVVDVIRNDGEVLTEGTPLTAEGLKNAFSEVERLIGYLLVQNCSVEEIQPTLYQGDKGEVGHFRVNVNENLIVTVDNSEIKDYFDVTVSQNEQTNLFSIFLEEKELITNSTKTGEDLFPFTIKYCLKNNPSNCVYQEEHFLRYVYSN